MSKLLKKFLQNTIFPSALLVVSKVVGLYAAIKFFDLNFFIDTQPDKTFSIQVYFETTKEALLANSISNFILFLIMAIFTTYFLIKYRLSLLASYSPRALVKLNNWNLVPWVNTKGNSFLKTFIWIMFLWIVSIIAAADVISQNSFAWIGILSLTYTIILTWVLVRTFEIEAELIYPEKDTNNLC